MSIVALYLHQQKFLRKLVLAGSSLSMTQKNHYLKKISLSVVVVVKPAKAKSNFLFGGNENTARSAALHQSQLHCTPSAPVGRKKCCTLPFSRH